MWWPYKVTMAPLSSGTFELTDDDCAEDELVDMVTGQCGKMCSDDSRPSNITVLRNTRLAVGNGRR
jgi:hypothetical protein